MTATQRTLNAHVPDAAAGRRFDQVLAELFPDYSRSRLSAWIMAGAALGVLGRLPTGATVVFSKETSGQWGLDISGGDSSHILQHQPARLEIYRPTSPAPASSATPEQIAEIGLKAAYSINTEERPLAEMLANTAINLEKTAAALSI